MVDTSASLLERLRDQPSEPDWQRLVGLYTPLIRGWLARHWRLQDGDADDLVQEVLTTLVRKLPEFRRQRMGAFRSWLRTITVNALRHHTRARRGRPAATGDSDHLAWLMELEDGKSGLSQVWDREHDEFVMQRLLQMIRPDFRAKTWDAFERVAVKGEAVRDVANSLGLSENAVIVAKSHVLSRLRQEARGLLD